MRSRSHRLPVAEPRHDDWVDGSWTVDCVCGVTFDDGEEMVDCDECGVWVHTRCSRYVKSEKSFACHKCKSKSSGVGGGSGVRNESEETEVAEFLLELPTKTLRMENPNPAAVASRRPFKLRAGIPMEERVHVQGVPGGEPGLFSGNGMSSIFGPHLWKSTGYVPKKFNHKYTESHFLGKVAEQEEEEMDKTNGEKNVNGADNGARVLFSLLKKNESNLPTPVLDTARVKEVVEQGARDEITAPRQKKLGGEKSYSAPEDVIKKKSNSVTVVLHSGKRKKEESGMSKDQNVKKKVRAIEKEGYAKKQAVHSLKAASTFLSDAKHLEFSRDRGSKAVNDDRQCSKTLADQPLDRLGECATNLASNEHNLEATPRNDTSSDKMLRVEKLGVQVPVESEKHTKNSGGVQSLTEVNGLRSLPVKEEVTGDALQRCQAGNGSVGIGSYEKESVDVRIAGGDARESDHGQDSETDEANSRPTKKLKSDTDYHGDHLVESLHSNDAKTDGLKASTQYPELSVDVVIAEGKVVGTTTSNAETSEAKVVDASRSLTVVRPRRDKHDESACNAHNSKREHSGFDSSMVAKKSYSGLKPSLEGAGELPKSNGIARSHSTASYQRKAGASVLRSTSTSGIMSKSSENYMAATAQNSSAHSRQELSDSSQGTMKDNASADKVERVEQSGKTKKLVKESLRSSSGKKISETNKLSHASDSKKPPSDSKDPSIHSSSKVPFVSNLASSKVSGECASLPPTDMQTKATASSVPGKGEKSYNNPPSRGHVASMTSPASSNVPANLSDEELALLLHQELNSSPRVPRVPRMRNAGSLPQLAGSSATSTLMKRASSSGGKEQASRRRTKDPSGEGLHNYQEVENEAKKERKPNSPDNRRKDSSYNMNQLSRKDADGGLVKGLQSMKKTHMSTSLSSSADANGSSRPSARNDDPRMVGRQTNRTLPGLIADIMSEGKRMTYEELCNDVLPHWPHLRKHNGERYAYSSHSQAVLDCLRNRSEWARLVDRGPKTSASRKQRKLDADSMSIESEDTEDQKDSKDPGSKSFDSNQEDFPKGKRNARKRGRLSLQGRGIVRRLRRADVVSEDESESYSYSSEDSMSSEEEIQGGGTSTVGSEVSASSDEAQ